MAWVDFTGKQVIVKADISLGTSERVIPKGSYWVSEQDEDPERNRENCIMLFPITSEDVIYYVMDPHLFVSLSLNEPMFEFFDDTNYVLC